MIQAAHDVNIPTHAIKLFATKIVCFVGWKRFLSLRVGSRSPIIANRVVGVLSLRDGQKVVTHNLVAVARRSNLSSCLLRRTEADEFLATFLVLLAMTYTLCL